MNMRYNDSIEKEVSEIPIENVMWVPADRRPSLFRREGLQTSRDPRIAFNDLPHDIHTIIRGFLDDVALGRLNCTDKTLQLLYQLDCSLLYKKLVHSTCSTFGLDISRFSRVAVNFLPAASDAIMEWLTIELDWKDLPRKGIFRSVKRSILLGKMHYLVEVGGTFVCDGDEVQRVTVNSITVKAISTDEFKVDHEEGSWSAASAVGENNDDESIEDYREDVICENPWWLDLSDD